MAVSPPLLATPRLPIARSALDAIGNTPLVALSRLTSGPGRLLAKAEYRNPGGSIKDRPARWIIECALAEGRLAPGQSVVEMTSGNMGAGLAVVCAVLGHPFVAVMSVGNSSKRREMMTALGAEVVLVPQVDGRPGEVTGADVKAAANQARNVAASTGAYYVNQFFNPGSVEAHRRSTGPEIWRDCEGQLDAFVASVGSGGTFVGTSSFLKSKHPKLCCVAVEPVRAAALSGRVTGDGKHVIQGTGYGVVPPHWQPALCDHVVTVEDADVVEMKRRLAVEEGLFVGFSAAANVLASLEVLELLTVECSEPTVVTVLCDTGLKY